MGFNSIEVTLLLILKYWDSYLRGPSLIGIIPVGNGILRMFCDLFITGRVMRGAIVYCRKAF